MRALGRGHAAMVSRRPGAAAGAPDHALLAVTVAGSVEWKPLPMKRTAPTTTAAPTRPPATRPSPPTSRRASTSSRARRRTSASTSSTTSTRPPSRPRRSWRAGRTRRARPSCASLRRSASRASPSCRPPRARSTGARVAAGERRRRRARPRRCSRSTRPSSRPRSPPTTTNVEETARKVDRDEVEAADRAISRAERVLCGTDQMAFFASYLRHLLMLLDLRAEVVASPVAGGAEPARPHRRAARW